MITNDMTVSCDVARDMIPLYADGAASEKTRELVAGHLGNCEDCRAYYRSVRKALGTSSHARRKGRLSMGGFAGIADKIKRRRTIYKTMAIILSMTALSSLLYILFQPGRRK